MADVDHPKTHVEDQDIDLPRTQPESPHHEGIDPLTESDTLYPAEDVKGDSVKAEKREEKEAVKALDSEPEPTPAEETVSDQQEVAAKANTPDALLPDEPSTDTETAPGQADDATPDAGEKAEPQEPHTDKGNTSPANRTKSSKK